jgi:hypothetical protein
MHMARFRLPATVATLSVAATVGYQHLCRQLCFWPNQLIRGKIPFSVRPLESGASVSCCHSSRRVYAASDMVLSGQYACATTAGVQALVLQPGADTDIQGISSIPRHLLQKCTNGNKACSGACVDIKSDPANCGK